MSEETQTVEVVEQPKTKKQSKLTPATPEQIKSRLRSLDVAISSKYYKNTGSIVRGVERGVFPQSEFNDINDLVSELQELVSMLETHK